ESGETPPPAVMRLAMPTPPELAAAVARRLAGEDISGLSGQQQITLSPDLSAADALYLDALESKLAFLNELHTQAAQRRKARYDLANLTPEEYRKRVAESII